MIGNKTCLLFVFIASDFEQGIVARYQLEEAQQGLHSPEFKSNDRLPAQDHTNLNHVSMMDCGEPDFTALSKHCQFVDMDSLETKQKIAFMKIPAKVGVCSVLVQSKLMESRMRLLAHLTCN